MSFSDQTFVSAFLLTHRLILSSAHLLELLIQRYNVPYPKKCDADIKSKFEAKVVRPVRLRGLSPKNAENLGFSNRKSVFNALKQWVDKFSVDFSDDELAQQVVMFAEQTMKVSFRFCSCILFNSCAKNTGMQKPGERLVEGLRKIRFCVCF
jgi:hypothetical protein